MRGLLLLCALCGIVLSGCAAVQQGADAIARDRARQAVAQVVDRTIPGANVTPVTDCIIDEASAQEIVTIARASVSGVDERTVSLVLDIARRPEAVSCIARSVSPALLGAV